MIAQTLLPIRQFIDHIKLLLLLLLFSRSVVSDSLHFAAPWTAACQASLSFTISWNLVKLTSIESVMPSNHLILCHPLLPLPSIFPSIRVFSKISQFFASVRINTIIIIIFFLKIVYMIKHVITRIN